MILYSMAGVAIFVSVLAFILGLFPLSETSRQYTEHYVVMMICGDAVIIALPFILFKKLRGVRV